MQVTAALAENQAETTSDYVPIQTKFSCTWDGCPYGSSSEATLPVHLKQHASSVLRQWSQHSTCMWQGCKSKASFKDERLYKLHLQNIHINPLVCPILKCHHKRPFRDYADLFRHRSTAHSVLRPYVCPFENCPEEVSTFARKDKWVKHIREIPHEGDKFCPYYHCTEQATLSAGFQTREEISKHFAKLHSNYESSQILCALGACAFNPESERWTSSGLQDHLKRFHGMESDDAQYSQILVILEGTAQVLRHAPWRVNWHDCTVFTQSQLPQQEIQRGEMVFQPVISDGVPTDFMIGLTY